MSMSTNAQVSSTNQLNVAFSAIREKAVAKKWELIREGFVQYTLKVCLLSSRRYVLLLAFTDAKYIDQRASRHLSKYVR